MNNKPARVSVKTLEFDKNKRFQDKLSLRKQIRDEDFKRRRFVKKDMIDIDTSSSLVVVASQNELTQGQLTQSNQNVLNQNAQSVPNGPSSRDVELGKLLETMLQRNGTLPADLLQNLNNNTDLLALSYALGVFTDLLTHEDSCIIQKVVDANLAPRFIDCMLNCVQSKQVQIAAANCLVNMAVGSTPQIMYMVRCNVIQALFEVFKRTQHFEIWECAIWTLGNISGDNIECRDAILDQGGFLNVLNIINLDVPRSVLTIALWCLVNFVREKPLPNFALLCHAFPTIERLLDSNDFEVLEHACCFAHCVTEDACTNESKLDYILTKHPGILPKIVKILKQSFDMPDTHASSRRRLQSACARTCGNFAVAEQRHCKFIVDCGAIPVLLECLEVTDMPHIKQFICWTFSNIACDSPASIQTLITTPGLLPKMVHLVLNECFDIMKEAVWTLSNAVVHASQSQLNILVNQNVLVAFCSSLNDSNPRVILITLQALQVILRYGKELAALENSSINKFTQDIEELHGLDQLEALQANEHKEISSHSFGILSDYFEQDTDKIQVEYDTHTMTTDMASTNNFNNTSFNNTSFEIPSSNFNVGFTGNNNFNGNNNFDPFNNSNQSNNNFNPPTTFNSSNNFTLNDNSFLDQPIPNQFSNSVQYQFNPFN